MKAFLIALLFTTTAHAVDFKDCTQLKEQCFDVQNFPQKSFFMAGTDKTKVAVFVHGLSDSPYFTKDIAQFLNSQGYYVYSVLLSGHGLTPEALLDISSSQWLNDVKRTIRKALSETGAKQVVLSGFSLGGVLVTDLAEDAYWKNKISKLILMAPAFEVKNQYAPILCAADAYYVKTWASDSPGSTPVKYNKLALKAVCELLGLASQTIDNSRSVTVPVFAVVTDADQTINTEAAIDTFHNMTSDKNKLFYIRNQNTSHTAINFKNDPIGNRRNPLFDQMSKKLILFLNN
jgi:carboxylesterase